MTDLRDRIATILADTHLSGTTTFYGMADALINQLDLTETAGVIIGCNHNHYGGGR